MEPRGGFIPVLCQFISGAVYDDKLHAEASAASRIVKSGRRRGPHPQGSGDCVRAGGARGQLGQASEEEALTIAAIVRELRGRELTGTTGERARRASALDENDLLVVAPYNMQVRALRAALPNVRVGSVDRVSGAGGAGGHRVDVRAARGTRRRGGSSSCSARTGLNVALSTGAEPGDCCRMSRFARTRMRTVPQMKLVNLFCRILEEGG